MLFMLTVCDHLKEFLSIEFLFDFHFQNDSGSASVLFLQILTVLLCLPWLKQNVSNVSVSFLSSGLSLFYHNPYLPFLCSACLSLAFLRFACLSFACLTSLVTVSLISVLFVLVLFVSVLFVSVLLGSVSLVSVSPISACFKGLTMIAFLRR